VSLSLTGTWRTGLARCKRKPRRPLRSCASLCLRSVSRVLRVLSRPAVRVGVLARRLFGVRVARDVNETSQHAAMANIRAPRRTRDGRRGGRSGEGPARPQARPGGAVARSSRVIAAGEATAQAIGPVPVAHPAVWTPGLCGSGVPSVPRIGTLQRPGHVPRETPPHTETLSRVTCVGRSRRGKSADRPEAERAGPESAHR